MVATKTTATTATTTAVPTATVATAATAATTAPPNSTPTPAPTLTHHPTSFGHARHSGAHPTSTCSSRAIAPCSARPSCRSVSNSRVRRMDAVSDATVSYQPRALDIVVHTPREARPRTTVPTLTPRQLRTAHANGPTVLRTLFTLIFHNTHTTRASCRGRSAAMASRAMTCVRRPISPSLRYIRRIIQRFHRPATPPHPAAPPGRRRPTPPRHRATATPHHRDTAPPRHRDTSPSLPLPLFPQDFYHGIHEEKFKGQGFRAITDGDGDDGMGPLNKNRPLFTHKGLQNHSRLPQGDPRVLRAQVR